MSDLTLFPKPELPPGGVTAQHVVAATVEALRPVPITSRQKGMIARQAKELLADGFEPEVVFVACVTAIRRRAAHHAHLIAQDIALAKAGAILPRKDYERGMLLLQGQLRPPPEPTIAEGLLAERRKQRLQRQGREIA